MTRASLGLLHLAHAPARFHTASMAWTDLRERKALIRWGLVFAVGFALVGALHVWLRLQVLDTRYRLGAAQKAWARLDAEHDALVAELARIEEAQSIEAMALARLGLKRPDSGQEVLLP